MTTTPILVPHPRTMAYTGNTLQLNLYDGIPVSLSSADEFAIASYLKQSCGRIGHSMQIYLSAAQAKAERRGIVFTPIADCPPQGYHLQITETQISIAYTTLQGLFYGCVSLIQLIEQSPAQALPCVRIDDAPDFQQRGFMLDISRDRVPTMATLKQLIDDLARLKINQLQLYMEHTFAYPGHAVVWQHASPITSEELLELKHYCAERFIELVPNQNSLGHMERWLKHPQYRELSETPDGFEDYAGRWRSPSTLNPLDPDSLNLMRDLYAALLPHFDSALFNVGCDEPWELGRGKSKPEYDKYGGRVYLDWLLKLYNLVTEHDRKMMFWGDIIIKYPDLIPELPDDIIVMEWGYEATHPFDSNCEKYAASGIPFYVCPGTSSWNTLVGRVDNAIGNLKAAAIAGRKHGAIGYLITDWGDAGHWQPMVASYAGIVYGAAVSWCLERNQELSLPNALDVVLYRDSNAMIGQLTVDTGNIYKQLPPEHINGQLLAYALQWQREEIPKILEGYEQWGGEPANIKPDTLRRVIPRLDELQQQLSAVNIAHPDGELMLAEWHHTIHLLKHSAKWLLLAQNQTDYDAASLLHELNSLKMRQRNLWLRRSRRGGLEDSMLRFDTLTGQYQAMIDQKSG